MSKPSFGGAPAEGEGLWEIQGNEQRTVKNYGTNRISNTKYSLLPRSRFSEFGGDGP
jgi:hypothetical protein